MKYFSSDYHLGHKHVIPWSNRPFNNIEEMNEKIISNIESLPSGSDLYFLGDLSWDMSILDGFFNRMRKANIHFHWILGNHDEKHGAEKYRKNCSSQSHMKDVYIGDKTPVVLCHYPMLTWNKSHYNSFMLYGHHHANSHGTAELVYKAEGKMLNVNVEFHDYKPWSEEEIIEYMKMRPDNWDLIRRG